MAKDKARDDRRSVGSHEKMTAALGRATGSAPRNDLGMTWSMPKVKGGLRSRGGDESSSPVRAMAVVPGQAHVKVGQSRTNHETGATYIGSEESHYNEVYGTAGVSGKKTKKGAPTNVKAED
jgi:hypothetical protein